MNIGRYYFAPLIVALTACSSSGSTGTGDQGVGDDPDPGTTVNAPDTNPEGVPYPTDNIGTRARAFNTPGNRMQNFKFYGYPDGKVDAGLEPISLANYFDPTGTKYKLIHVQASGSWCPHCQNEAGVLEKESVKAALAQRKVVWIVSLAEGPTPGQPSTEQDLVKWMKQFPVAFPHVLDSGNRNLGVFYNAAALPWNANLNAKTMEILSSAEGGLETEDALLGDVDRWLSKLDDGSIQ